MKYLLTLFFCVFLSLASQAQRDTIALNTDWQFAVDLKAEGMPQQWFTKALPNARKVQIPHTWNVEKDTENHYGWGWYQKSLSVPASWKNKNVVLQFGAINHTSHVYVNGKKVMENIGDGFNKLFVNLNGKLEYGKENIITVASNNDYGKNKAPYTNSFDWPNDGGLIRTVALLVSDKPAISYINVLPTLQVKDNSGKMQVKLGFEEPGAKNLKLRISIIEENQPTKKVVHTATVTPTWNKNEAHYNLSLPKVNPWHFDFPNLYRVEVTVLNGRKAVDKVTTDVGFREIRFENGKTYLNGEHIKMMGVEWTAGSNPDYGLAEPKSEIIKHARMMKDVNAIFSRQHFQQSDEFYDFCNRNGIILQEEIPLWGPETPSNETIKSIATLQLERMVRNHYNHPSIFAWGVGNELDGRNANMKAMIQGLLDKARALDPSRHVTYVSNTLKNGFNTSPNFVPDAGSLGDYLMMNEYGGSWWDIPVGTIHQYLDSIHMSYPDKPFFISEFGLCGPNFKGGDERRIEDLIYHMAVYETKPYIEGAIYFDLTDYRTHYPGTSEKNKFRRRVHGVYDMYGKPKPSMKVLREVSSPLEVQQVNVRGKGKSSVLIYGSKGLPQHTVKGYKLYISDKTDNYATTKAYDLPEIKPGQRVTIEVEDPFDGKGIVTVVRPTGFITSQKSFLE
ncbi:glycoside hydrolase family 2 protein [Rufibacter glacialis]|uniref:Beta-galactosidase n=1 Tax=Rufibacter glacialis TaxID=1259555 RepID=A0A5M8QFJ8_9BACT|nr:sugar-binding domain-containing protein [Rufibacter glacialis]KAA6434807.1 beta-galactosidase [Rufibacter glacialis]GGK72602.1 beta-galactosidase [Rufibacter glacialis]